MSTEHADPTSSTPVPPRPVASAAQDLEGALTSLAWNEAAFDPTRALGSLGVEVPAGISLDVRVQRPDTLYFVIPPFDGDGGHSDGVLNQMDLWSSGDQFVWVLPQDAKVALLDMREQFRSTNGDGR